MSAYTAFKWLAWTGIFSYGMYNFAATSNPDLPSEKGVIKSKDASEIKSIETKTILGGGPSDLRTLRDVTAEKRRKLSEEYAQKMYEETLKKQKEEEQKQS